MELVAVSLRTNRLRARILPRGQTFSIRPRPGDPLPVEGESFTLRVERAWTSGALPWVEGEVSFLRLDAAALELRPLALWQVGPWPPAGEAAAGPAGRVRPAYEMERLIPARRRPPLAGDEPLREAMAIWNHGDPAAAEALLGELLLRDLRCLDAHAHLGFFAFNGPAERGGAERARRHYEAGLRIGELSLPAAFDGLLPWSRPGNQPFLRCLFGFGISLWRLGELEAARAALDRLCRLDPADQMAARLALGRIERRAQPASLTASRSG